MHLARAIATLRFAQSQTTKSSVASSVATVCACGLVLASMGFGSVYAWQQGSEHSLTLGALTVLFAVCLEGAKPFAVSAALDQFKQWSVIRGLALAVLALVAIVYSLTAELSLVAQVRSDIDSERSTLAQQTQIRLTQYERAQEELESLAESDASLRLSRSIGEIDAEIVKLKAENPRAGDCTKLNGPVSRSVCPQVAALEGEKERTRRRLELEAILAKPVIDERLSSFVLEANPGSRSWALVLSVVGIDASVETINRLLNLVPVLAMELGSALAMVLVGSLAPAKGIPTAEPQAESSSESSKAVESPLPKRASAATVRTRDRVSLQLIEYLRELGGSSLKSHRSIAQAIQADRNTVRRAIGQLVAEGIVQAQPSKKGTVLTLLS